MTSILIVKQPNDLAQYSPDEIRSWLAFAWGGQLGELKDFNWLGLSEMLTTRVTSTAPAIAIEWAYLAKTVFDFLLGRVSTDQKESLMISQMMMRAYLIRALGDVPNDSVLSVDQIVRWFIEGLTLKFPEVLQMTANISGLKIEDIRILRKLKNRLSILMFLYTDTGLSIDGHMQDWLGIHSKLP